MLSVVDSKVRSSLERSLNRSLVNVVYEAKIAQSLSKYINKFGTSRSGNTFTRKQFNTLVRIGRQGAPIFRSDTSADRNYVNSIAGLTNDKVYHSNMTDVTYLDDIATKREANSFVRMCIFVANFTYSIGRLEHLDDCPLWLKKLSAASGLPDASVQDGSSPLYLPDANPAQLKVVHGKVVLKNEEDNGKFHIPGDSVYPYAVFTLTWSKSSSRKQGFRSFSAIMHSKTPVGVYDFGNEDGTKSPLSMRNYMRSIVPLSSIDDGGNNKSPPRYLFVEYQSVIYSTHLSLYVELLPSMDRLVVAITGEKGSGKSSIIEKLPSTINVIDSDDWGRAIAQAEVLFANGTYESKYDAMLGAIRAPDPEVVSIFKQQAVMHFSSRMKNTDLTIAKPTPFSKFYNVMLNDENVGIRSYVQARKQHFIEQDGGERKPVLIFTHTTTETSLILGTTIEAVIQPVINPLDAISNRPKQDALNEKHDAKAETMLHDFYKRRINGTLMLTPFSVLRLFEIGDVWDLTPISEKSIEQSVCVDDDALNVAFVTDNLDEKIKDSLGDEYNELKAYQYSRSVASTSRAIEMGRNVGMLDDVIKNNLVRYRNSLLTKDGLIAHLKHSTRRDPEPLHAIQRSNQINSYVNNDRGFKFDDVTVKSMVAYSLLSAAEFENKHRNSKNKKVKTVLEALSVMSSPPEFEAIIDKHKADIFPDLPGNAWKKMFKSKIALEKKIGREGVIAMNKLWVRIHCGPDYIVKGMKTSDRSILVNRHVFEDALAKYPITSRWTIEMSSSTKPYTSFGEWDKIVIDGKDKMILTCDDSSLDFTSHEEVRGTFLSNSSFVFDGGIIHYIEPQSFGSTNCKINPIEINKYIPGYTVNRAKLYSCDEHDVHWCGEIIYDSGVGKFTIISVGDSSELFGTYQ